MYVRVRCIRIVLGLMVFLTPSASLVLAGQDCKRAVELYNKGTLSEDPQEKESYFKQAISLCSEPEILSRVYNNLADTYEKQGQLSLALEFYKKALEKKPDSAISCFSVGDIFFELGDYYSAYVMYNRGLKYDQMDKEALEKRDLAKGEFEKKMIIYFDFDSADISRHYNQRLDVIGEAIRAHGRSTGVKVIGHTCDIGPQAYNKDISVKRALQVAEYLTHRFSMDPSSIETLGMGEEDPLLPNTDEKARALNRRVEVIVSE
jgi:outer membrane protein OmpA-like peptidoglycan-associated protein